MTKQLTEIRDTLVLAQGRNSSLDAPSASLPSNLPESTLDKIAELANYICELGEGDSLLDLYKNLGILYPTVNLTCSENPDTFLGLLVHPSTSNEVRMTFLENFNLRFPQDTNLDEVSNFSANIARNLNNKSEIKLRSLLYEDCVTWIGNQSDLDDAGIYFEELCKNSSAEKIAIHAKESFLLANLIITENLTIKPKIARKIGTDLPRVVLEDVTFQQQMTDWFGKQIAIFLPKIEEFREAMLDVESIKLEPSRRYEAQVAKKEAVMPFQESLAKFEGALALFNDCSRCFNELGGKYALRYKSGFVDSITKLFEVFDRFQHVNFLPESLTYEIIDCAEIFSIKEDGKKDDKIPQIIDLPHSILFSPTSLLPGRISNLLINAVKAERLEKIPSLLAMLPRSYANLQLLEEHSRVALEARHEKIEEAICTWVDSQSSRLTPEESTQFADYEYRQWLSDIHALRSLWDVNFTDESPPTHQTLDKLKKLFSKLLKMDLEGTTIVLEFCTRLKQNQIEYIFQDLSYALEDSRKEIVNAYQEKVNHYHQNGEIPDPLEIESTMLQMKLVNLINKISKTSVPLQKMPRQWRDRLVLASLCNELENHSTKPSTSIEDSIRAFRVTNISFFANNLAEDEFLKHIRELHPTARCTAIKEQIENPDFKADEKTLLRLALLKNAIQSNDVKLITEVRLELLRWAKEKKYFEIEKGLKNLQKLVKETPNLSLAQINIQEIPGLAEWNQYMSAA